MDIEQRSLLVQDFLPLGLGQGLQLQTGLVDVQDRQAEEGIPHLYREHTYTTHTNIKSYFDSNKVLTTVYTFLLAPWKPDGELSRHNPGWTKKKKK